MTREEQIKQAAAEHHKDVYNPKRRLAHLDFIAGAEWADQHPDYSDKGVLVINHLHISKEEMERAMNEPRHLMVVEQPSPWVSVEERLPEEADTYFLLYENHGTVDLGMYRRSRGFYNCADPNPTHWMPIPPTEKGGEI